MFEPHWLKAFGQHLWRHFLEDRCFEAAGSLSYKTLIAIVPLLAVVIGIVSSFGVFADWIGQVESYIFTHFVPAKGDEVQAYINEFIGRTAGLTASGSVFLIVISVLLMGTIERTFNRIWRVRHQRSWLNRVVMYWAVLTLGPMLVGASLVLSSYLAFVSGFAPEALQHAVGALWVTLAPFMIAWAGFALVFVLVPHRRVLVRHALIGAFLSAVLFELAKGLFVFYLGYSTTYQHLYGALATVPIFLLWIYILWVVVLLGASLSAALTTFHVGGLEWSWSKRFEFPLLLRILHHLWAAQLKGNALSVEALNLKEPGATHHQIQGLVALLYGQGIVRFDEDDRLILAADLDEWSVDSLYHLGEFVLPLDEIEQLPKSDGLNERIIEFFKELNSHLPTMARSIKSLVAEPPKDNK
ncbi:MAG TPA: YihY family inner membrane protein [Wenzhouxiangella sp.]